MEILEKKFFISISDAKEYAITKYFHNKSNEEYVWAKFEKYYANAYGGTGRTELKTDKYLFQIDTYTGTPILYIHDLLTSKNICELSFNSINDAKDYVERVYMSN